MATKRKFAVIDGVSGEVSPLTFKARQRVALPKTPKQALQEAASVYAATRRGELPPDVGARLVYMAKTCCDISEVATIEPRIAAIEERVNALAAKLLV